MVPASAWRTLRADPTPRQQVATTVADGTVWVIGGITQGAASNLMEGYDPAIDTWKTGIPLPVGLSHEMAVTYRGEIVVLGGWEAQGGNLTAVSSKKVYAQRGGGWVELPPMLSSHVAGGAVVVGDQIIVSGGQADGKLNPTTEVFDGTAWKRVADLPTPREHLGMATDGTYRVRGGRARPVVGQEQRRAGALRPEDRLVGRARGHARRRAAGSEPRWPTGGWSWRAARSRPPSTTPSSPTTSRPTRGRTCPRCPPVGTGSPWRRWTRRSTRSAAPPNPATRRRPGWARRCRCRRAGCSPRRCGGR